MLILYIPCRLQSNYITTDNSRYMNDQGSGVHHIIKWFSDQKYRSYSTSSGGSLTHHQMEWSLRLCRTEVDCPKISPQRVPQTSFIEGRSRTIAWKPLIMVTAFQVPRVNSLFVHSYDCLLGRRNAKMFLWRPTEIYKRLCRIVRPVMCSSQSEGFC